MLAANNRIKTNMGCTKTDTNEIKYLYNLAQNPRYRQINPQGCSWLNPENEKALISGINLPGARGKCCGTLLVRLLTEGRSVPNSGLPLSLYAGVPR